MSSDESYYWADGRRIPLRPSDQVVVDLDATGSLSTSADVENLGRNGRKLTGSLVMVPEASARKVFEGTPAGVHPVYRTDDGTLLAVLPEVRVEASRRRLDEVNRSVRGAHVTERDEERLVLVPDSGRGEDALRIANELSEEGGLEVSQARFLRVVNRPGP